jgi:hypothetical protein
MKNKRRQLPKEGLRQPGEGIGPGEQFLDVSDDVQGHGFPMPAPPADFSKGTPSQGGEFDSGESGVGPEGIR